jgi:hypothetical protein
MRYRLVCAFDVGVAAFAVLEFEEFFGGVTATTVPLPPHLLEIVYVVDVNRDNFAVQVVEFVASETGGWALEMQVMIHIGGVAEFIFTFPVPVQVVEGGGN